jgi:soluble lytic murein transglycosylase-like protein
MQLMPGTAKRFGVTEIWDPVDNLRGGMAYLRWLIERFDGRIPLALAAYNAGEHAVDRYNGIPPYKETQRYVQRITRQVAADSPHKPATTQQTKRHSRRSDRLARMLQAKTAGE